MFPSAEARGSWSARHTSLAKGGIRLGCKHRKTRASSRESGSADDGVDRSQFARHLFTSKKVDRGRAPPPGRQRRSAGGKKGRECHSNRSKARSHCFANPALPASGRNQTVMASGLSPISQAISKTSRDEAPSTTPAATSIFGSRVSTRSRFTIKANINCWPRRS